MTWAWTEHVERGHRLVADDHVGAQREGARDADALPLAAGELVRVAVHVVRVEADDLQELLHAGAAAAFGVAVDRERLADDVADGHPRVQRGVRVLHDHLHPAAQRRSSGRDRPDRSRSSNRTLPEVGVSTAIRSLASVLLPQPDSPTRPSVSPLRSVNDDAVDRLDLPDLVLEHDALGEREVLDQVAYLEDLLSHTATETSSA